MAQGRAVEKRRIARPEKERKKMRPGGLPAHIIFPSFFFSTRFARQQNTTMRTQAATSARLGHTAVSAARPARARRAAPRTVSVKAEKVRQKEERQGSWRTAVRRLSPPVAARAA